METFFFLTRKVRCLCLETRLPVPLLHQKIIMNGILFFQIFLKSFENAHARLPLLLIRTSVKKILTSSAANEKKLFRFQKFTRGSEMSVLRASMREFQTVIDFWKQYTFFFYKNHVYKNIRAYFSSKIRTSSEHRQALNWQKNKNIKPLYWKIRTFFMTSLQFI